MTRGRSILILLLLAGLIYLAGTQTWVVAELAGERSEISGGEGQPVQQALALAGVVAVLFFALSGRIGRWITAIVLALIGVGSIAVAAQALADPAGLTATTLVEATGLATRPESAEATAWPWLAIVAGGLLTLAAPTVAQLSKHWKARVRRFERADAPGGAEPEDDPAASWDALSRGEDPSEER